MDGDLIANVDSAQEAKRRNADALLRKVFFGVSTLRKARNLFAEQLAPDFCFFDYLRTDECGLSRCLVDLLNPQGKHGQGRLFLDLLLERLNANTWAGKDQCHEVVAEKIIENMRRIDVYLKFNRGVIGIENKPWAKDQEQQLSDYADWLKKDANGREWHLVYLCNHDPAEGSIDQDKLKEIEDNFEILNYNKVVEWLERCAEKAKAMSVRVFVNELAKFIRTNINMEIDMSEYCEIKKSILSSAENLESALLISRSIPEIKNNLIRQFVLDLTGKIMKKPYRVEWDQNFQSGGEWSGFNFVFRENQDKYLRFQFYRKFEGLSWGIARKPGTKNEDVGKINQKMTTAFGRDYAPDDWWAWNSKVAELGEDFVDWTISVKPWQEMRDNTLADRFIAIVDKVYTLFENCQHLLMPPQTDENSSSS